jgi:serine/threonine protein kinase
MQSSSCNFYRIGRVLGRGAFGKVNLACHKVTEHLVAVKALEKKVLDNEKSTKKRVMQEIAILKQSNHHNVVRLYDSFETHKHICFVMELCQGGDLLSYVRKRRKLKEDNAKYLFKQLIEGLNYIHTQKFVIHRDIKLDNILLDASGRIKICDFGVSKQVKSDRERMYEQCGTPAYIAPEVSNKNKGYKGFKADMWSAGVCLYVMLIGTVPFRAGSMKELHELIRKGKYSL